MEIGTIRGLGFVVDIDGAQNDYVVVRITRLSGSEKRIVVFVSRACVEVYTQDEDAPLLGGQERGEVFLDIERPTDTGRPT